ncbi:scarecrow-like protein 14 [Phtheirospermum japonicum]|uniref:Scarecrow-like protein 14 n=1 Tax=Phtheirospermum japonicum TaxID=374723 RepID=A0A830BKT0_9LAMI|nr:scarecrow-like protein 14 [Phtheirospermum japonicum]
MFDMFEATVPQDDKDILLFEQQFFGKEAMNIIACDGTKRIERPESYKHWQTRIVRAGFRQLLLDQEIIKRVIKVKIGYHKNFLVDEDGKWILLGWKGHVGGLLITDHLDNLFINL